MHLVSLIFTLAAWTATPPVNAVVGDASVAAGYVPSLDGLAPAAIEQARVQGHLRYIHDRLAAAEPVQLSSVERAARARNLARLARYAEAGVFPRNDDHPDARRPTFVDRRGRICAVGALFAADRGRTAAERIAREHKYAYLVDIDDAELAAWQRTSGLSKRELAMIQPEYGPGDNRPLWTPSGLLDRMLLGPGRASATSELTGSGVALALHAQGRPVATRLRLYSTLTVMRTAGAIDGEPRVIDPDDNTRVRFGAVDAGLYVPLSNAMLLRAGVVAGSSADTAAFAGARVGDAVLGLPRHLGGRLSLSTMFGPYPHQRSQLTSFSERMGLRVDIGVDAGFLTEDRTFVIPRAGVGFLTAFPHMSLALETAISRVPEADGRDHVRFSAGVTTRMSRSQYRDYGPFARVQPALTLAGVRTIDGWGASFALDVSVAMSAARRREY